MPERTGFADDAPQAVTLDDPFGTATQEAPRRSRNRRAAPQPEPDPSDQGFAPEPPAILDQLFEAIEARRGLDPRATIQYVQNMITTLEDIKTRTEQAVETASLNANEAQEQLYGLHNELGLFKSNLVPHSVHAYGKVIPKVTARGVEESQAGLTKEQVATALVAIEKEFASCRMEYSQILNRNCFIVRTHNIILSQPNGNGNGMMEFDFGPFDICLDMRRFASNQGKPYYVVAVDPRLPPGRGNCAHPHVLDNVMCEGNAGDVLAKVLKRGDLYTFFVVINQTLSVYNRHSPHVALEKWIQGANRDRNAIYCPQCEEIVESADRRTCHGCGNAGHDDCFEYCEETERFLCRNCREYFQANDEHCNTCDDVGSSGCIIRTNVRCRSCDGTFEPSLTTRCPVSGYTLCGNCYEQNAINGRACCDSYSDARCLLRTRHNASVDALTY